MSLVRIPNLAAVPPGVDLPASSLLDSFLASLNSDHSRRAYAQGINNFVAWAKSSSGGRAGSLRQLVLLYREYLRASGLSSATINLRLAAVRAFFREAADSGTFPPDAAQAVAGVEGVPQRGDKIGTWLTARQVRTLLSLPDRSTRRGKRDFAILAMLFGCGIRRSELAALDLSQITLRENRWVVADLRGKGGRVRTLPIPEAMKDAIDEWTRDANIQKGKVFRRLLKNSRVHGEGLSPEAILQIALRYSLLAQEKDHQFPVVKPHDARRTYAKLCRKKGALLEEIQWNLGHESLTTTERYLGKDEILENSINDRLPIFDT